jgi:hypothetical protein
MKAYKCLVFFISLALMAVTFGCGGNGGGGDGSGSSTGIVAMSITDAKPVLPANVTNCFVTIDEVLVHSSGGGWETLPLVQTPSTIDLLQYTNGTTTELVPPVAVGTGRYTQIRLSVVSAKLRFNNNPNEEAELTIPSENLKTDKNFEFEVTGIAPAHITIDFDLSQSIVVEGPAGNESYKLKPVLHIVEDSATIEGTIAYTSFRDLGDTPYVVITVLDSNGQQYTKVQVERDNNASQTEYSIFWLEPNQSYTVLINYNPVADDNPATLEIEETPDDTVEVPSNPNDVLQPGEIYILNFPLPA